MYKTCKTTKSKLRQREIEQALISLMASTPFADVSVTALCAHLDMPRKSFYRYFDAKEDVLDAFMDHLLEECDAITLSDATLRQRVEQLLFFAKRKKDLLRHFGTVKAIASADFDELIRVVPRDTAQNIIDFFEGELK